MFTKVSRWKEDWSKVKEVAHYETFSFTDVLAELSRTGQHSCEPQEEHMALHFSQQTSISLQPEMGIIIHQNPLNKQGKTVSSQSNGTNGNSSYFLLPMHMGNLIHQNPSISKGTGCLLGQLEQTEFFSYFHLPMLDSTKSLPVF